MLSILSPYHEYLLRIKGVSSHTLRAYFSDLTRFILSWQRETGREEEEVFSCSSQEIRSYLAKRRAEGIAQTSLARELSVIRGWFDYLVRREVVENNPTHSFSSRGREHFLPNYLTTLELEEIRNHFGNTFWQLRERAIFETLYSSGCRVFELVGLTRNQIFNSVQGGRVQSSEVVLIRGKGERSRYLFLSKVAREALNLYESERRARENERDEAIKKLDALWLNARGEELTVRGVYYLCEKWGREAGLAKRVHPHAFRHTFGTDMLNEGANIRAVQEFLGHSSLSSTQIYTHTSRGRLQEIHRNFHPRSRRKE